MPAELALWSLGSFVPLGIWLYLVFWRGQFWQVNRHFLPKLDARGQTARVAVVIPARDEADLVGTTVTSLFRQEYAGELRLFLVDDGSTDGTADVARAAAKVAGAAERLTVVQGVLRPGWTGKMSAVAEGVERALEAAPDYLLLTDADIEHDLENVGRLVAMAESGSYDLVSLMVKLQTATVAERALIPAFVFLFFLLYPPKWIQSRRKRTAGAAGGCMLVRPGTLARAGGIAAIKSEIIDDCALARVIKRSGGSVWLGLAEQTRSTRSYGGFAAVGRMISRTAFNQLNHSALLLPGTIAGLGITYLLPVVLTSYGKPPFAVFGAAAWLLMTAAYLPMVTFYGLNPLWALSLPAVAVFYGAATIHSAVKFWLGRGGEWKGRAQDVAGIRSGRWHK